MSSVVSGSAAAAGDEGAEVGPGAVGGEGEARAPARLEAVEGAQPDPHLGGLERHRGAVDDRGTADGQNGGTGTPAVTVSYSILLIEQKRRVQRKIPEILQKIEHGDQVIPAGGGMGGMGGGMGGGGGFF